MNVYELGPIDYWHGWTPVGKYVKDAPIEDVLPVLSFLLEASSKVGLTELRGGKSNPEIYISGMPPLESGDCDTEIIAGWKIDNNGTTYIASKISIPWLEKYRVYPKGALAR